MTLIQKAQDFAHRAHDSIGQRRKYTGEPYWVHTDAVAEIVAANGGSEYAVAAAHLHDYKEDVVTELQKLGRLDELAAFEAEYNQFPALTRLYVDELTDVFTRENHPNKNRAERKRLEAERIGRISDEGQNIKLSDLINNTESIVAQDKDFARVYLKEKMNLLGELTRGNPVLLQRATVQTLAAYQQLGLKLPMLGA